MHAVDELQSIAELGVVLTPWLWLRLGVCAGVALPEIEPTPDLPATLSARVLTGLLRDELGFEGLIASDSLTMGAIEGQVGAAGAAAGWLAGCVVGGPLGLLRPITIIAVTVIAPRPSMIHRVVRAEIRWP